MAYPPNETIWGAVSADAWRYKRRTAPVRLIILHCIRGETTMELQYSSYKNWMVSPDNVQRDNAGNPVWASMSDRAISHEGQLCVTLAPEFYPTWSAGHMDPIGRSYELAQPDNDTPLTEACLDRAAREVAKDCAQFNIPPIVLPYVSGHNGEAPGIARHDRSANGSTWGKSDPGRMFDDRDFERRVRFYMAKPTPEQELAVIRALSPALLACDMGLLHDQIHFLVAAAMRARAEEPPD